ncbi:BsuBI/PstI family type II restriction endonuclease [Methanoregula formicica]|uniref:BsuBI/PstI restriction endonuclease C-terminus n=1 Tax=Methanoregula formicica (strain DSM 22288 / NBRC 105244 / SMSP) TaxID=593750 RepID=L0HE59_METFS|nr:BsuBI/PstI family type II restriction endonuclease [Methanoregula formicica]AGB02290.1 BsuBI/PstI restriction endonuclease C-terminus [Methanoregula formicica SMSP]
MSDIQSPSLPSLPSIDVINQRLPLIFPMDTEHRSQIIGKMAVRTIFVMFYIGAIEGRNEWFQPAHVLNMDDARASRTNEESRRSWAKRREFSSDRSLHKWYADTTKESVRKQVILFGLIPLGAAVKIDLGQENEPRYALAHDFSILFDQDLSGEELTRKISEWQRSHLTRAALGATALRGSDSGTRLKVKIPNHQIISEMKLPPGKSSLIIKEVIEKFSENFLHEPHVIAISTSEAPFQPIDDQVIQILNLDFSSVVQKKILPDIILWDKYLDHGRSENLLIFIEVVASTGSMIQERKENIMAFLRTREYNAKVAFGTAFLSRTDEAYNKKNIAEISWGSFVWFAAEPTNIVILNQMDAENNKKLSDLIL